MKQLYFILIPTAFANALQVAENFKSREFNSLTEVPEAVNTALHEDNEEDEDEEVLVMSLSAFTNFYNESESATQYFITPVYVK